MPALKEIIEYNDSKGSKIFNGLIEVLIIISIISFSIQTLPDLPEKTRDFLNLLETIVVIIFTVEYILRIIVADHKLKYIFSFYGIIDLLAILPFYITAGIDLRALRMFRLFRILRAFKLFRYSKAITRFQKALKLIKEELIVFFFVTCFMLFLSAVGIYYFENPVQPEAFKSVFHSLWWAVITLTTVGYGDMIPITVGGKIFTFIILMIGLAIVAVPTGLITSAISRTKEYEE
jgi:voltage-gated potassium channel